VPVWLWAGIKSDDRSAKFFFRVESIGWRFRISDSIPGACYGEISRKVANVFLPAGKRCIESGTELLVGPLKPVRLSASADAVDGENLEAFPSHPVECG
jgi:hypothetical protein